MGKPLFWFFLVNALIVATLVPFIEDLALMAPLVGSVGAFVALLTSRWMAKLRHRMTPIVPGREANETERWLVDTVSRLSQRAGLLRVPQIAIYESSELNAFATGPSKRRALVAFSSSLMERMDRDEIEGVAAHEIAHVANGDMVTMTLIQAVVNTIVLSVIFPLKSLRIATWFSESHSWWVESLLWLAEVVVTFALTFLGSLVVKVFSRRREYAADAAAARYTDARFLVRALETLATDDTSPPKAELKYAALKINSSIGWLEFFSTHPAMEKRIARLMQVGQPELTPSGT